MALAGRISDRSEAKTVNSVSADDRQQPLHRRQSDCPGDGQKGSGTTSSRGSEAVLRRRKLEIIAAILEPPVFGKILKPL